MCGDGVEFEDDGDEVWRCNGKGLSCVEHRGSRRRICGLLRYGQNLVEG